MKSLYLIILKKLKLNFYQQNLESRCESTKSKMDKMLVDLNWTSLRVENTTNKIMSLKNLQFMEARVHDETESNINTAANSSNNNNQHQTVANNSVGFSFRFMVFNNIQNRSYNIYLLTLI